MENSTWHYLNSQIASQDLVEEQFSYHPPISYRPLGASWRFKLRLSRFRTYGAHIFDLLRTPSLFRDLSALESLYAGQKALVIANGPSQGFLKPGIVHDFIDNGGSVFTLNYFFRNPNLQNLPRFNFVTSDPNWDEDNISAVRREMSFSEGFLFCPSSQVDSWETVSGNHEVMAFCDRQFRSASAAKAPQLAPTRPRSYGSMTALKALALSLWMGFDEIFVIGFDNTYPREIFSDERNRILSLESHSNEALVRRDRSRDWVSLSDYIFHLYLLFSDIEQFSNQRITNLDPYSLTTSFQKVLSITDIEPTLLR